MAHNTFGSLLSLTSFGESHGPAIGGVLDGFPPGFRPDMAMMQRQLSRRASGRLPFSSARKEEDKLEFLSGLFEGKTTGAPLAFLIRNQDARPEDYDHLKEAYRPGHADLTYTLKYGHRDHRGGGRASARETATWVVAGSLAQQWLQDKGVQILAWVSSIGCVMLPPHYAPASMEEVMASSLAIPHPETEKKALEMLNKLASEGDSTGGVISGRISGSPAGIGEPVFDKFHASLGKALLSINAAKGVEFGEGFAASRMKGSEHNDPLMPSPAKQSPEFGSNHAGGLLGGITTGQDILFRLAFKPVSSIQMRQETSSTSGKPRQIDIAGRHDICVVHRAVPIVEALSALVTADFLLRYNAYQGFQD
jgi:chorismate synthase